MPIHNIKRKSLIHPVSSLMDLRSRARSNPLYEKLAKIAASNLGGPSSTLDEALRWLNMNAMETDEKGVVDEVNFVRDLVN